MFAMKRRLLSCRMINSIQGAARGAQRSQSYDVLKCEPRTVLKEDHEIEYVHRIGFV